MPQPSGGHIVIRSLVRILPWCMIVAVVLMSAYGVFHIYKLSPEAGQRKAALTPGAVAGVPLTAEELKTRLDDLKWLLTVIISVASLFAILQAAASFFNAQAFSKQADESIGRIEKLAKETEERYPVFAQTERVRAEAYQTLAAKLQFEGFDWRDLVYESMPLRERQQILSVDWYLSVDLIPRKSGGLAYVRDLRCLANFYASKWLYERKSGGSLADLERAEYYLELAREEAENDFYLLNDQGVLHLEYYRWLEPEPWTQSLKKAREFFNESLKKNENQQRCHYNLSIADGYEKHWGDSEDRLIKALAETTWEHTRLPVRECLIHYNLSCVRARIAYDAQSPVKEIKIEQCLESLHDAARIGLMRESTVNRDMDTADGDFYPLVQTGSAAIQAQLKDLRAKLWMNEGKPVATHPGRLRRAWDALWEP
jgi:hypothetical protein